MDPLGEAINQGIKQGISQGCWMALKMFWWVFPIAIALKLFGKWTNKKIDIWKWRRRNKKFRGFSNK